MRAVRRFLRSPAAAIGLVLLALVVGVALAAPLAFPGDPLGLAGRPLQWPGANPRFPLGTDPSGRDIAAQIFHGAPVCRGLGMAAPASWAVAAVRALGIANSLARLAHRAVPAAGRRQVRRAHSSVRRQAGTLSGPTAYQHLA